MTQNQIVLRHLKSGKTLTAYEAMEKYRILRLAGRIKELREMGYNIVNIPVNDRKTGAHYVKYKLEN